MISDGDVVNGSTIYTHAPTAIFFWNQNDRNRTRTKALTYVPAVQKVLDLTLNLLSLLGVCPICSMVGQTCFKNQINLMLNPTNRRKSWRYVIGKNISELLQKVSHRHRQKC